MLENGYLEALGGVEGNHWRMRGGLIWLEVGERYLLRIEDQGSCLKVFCYDKCFTSTHLPLDECKD
jgi:hypothetical protein